MKLAFRYNTILISICLAASLSGAEVLAANRDQADAILGTWLTGAEGKELAKAIISREDGEYVGRIVWLEYPEFREGDEPGMEGKPKVDLKNPDPDLRSRPVLGMMILSGFRFKPGKKWPWTAGTIYDPENGHTYSARMRLEENDTLRIKGFVLIPLFGRSTIWTRALTPE